MNNHINVQKVQPTGIFTNYIFKALPLAFDESMSYYECICNLLDYLKNTILPTINNNADAVIEIQNNVDSFEENMTTSFTEFTTTINNTVNELESYMNNYFDNLDVQEEINNKIDELVLNGTMDSLLNTNLTGSLSDLTTTDKSNLVSAINELNSKVNNKIQVVKTQLTLTTGTTRTEGTVALPEGYTKDNSCVVFKNYGSGASASKTDSPILSVSLTYDQYDGNYAYIVLNGLLEQSTDSTYTVYFGLIKIDYPN